MSLQLPLYTVLPLTFSFISFIIGTIYIYLYLKKVNTNLLFLGFWVISLSSFIFLVALSHLMPDCIKAIWLAKIYYVPLVLSMLFYTILMFKITKSRKTAIYYVIVMSSMAYLFIIFTKYFIPFKSSARDFTNRFIFHKGFLYYPLMFLLYFSYIYNTYILYKNDISGAESKFFKKSIYLSGMIILMILGINDFAGILNIYKTVPLLSYGFLFFIIIGVLPYFKNYILYFRDLNQNYGRTIRVFAKVLETHDRINYASYKRIGDYARFIGELMKFSESRLEKLELAPILHNIGKIGLPVRYLVKKNIPKKYKQKINQGKRIISNMILFTNMQDLIDFPDLLKIKSKDYSIDAQILSISDYINSAVWTQYPRHRTLDAIFEKIKKNKYINPNLISIITGHKILMEEIVFDNIISLKKL
ncbi:MAG: hypothetical protein JW827_02920 [Spirochaetes bacterium]|nr:hypothetical protein [Spirochaetota bacterium]